MEYVAGGTLATLIASSESLCVKDAILIQGQICAGLSTAPGHQPPVVHRDLAPAGIACLDT
jgi:serine/threonine protein kinase